MKAAKQELAAHNLVIKSVMQATEEGCDVWLCMADPSNNPDHPGWPLRNMLLMAAKQWHVTTLSVLCVRDQRGKLDSARSLCLSVVLPSIPSGNSHGYSTWFHLASTNAVSLANSGWSSACAPVRCSMNIGNL